MGSDTGAIVCILALLVQGGYALHAMGAARARSVAGVAARALIAAAVIALGTYGLGRLLVAWGRVDFSAGTAGPGRLRDFTRGPVEGAAVFFKAPGAFLGLLALAWLPAALFNASTAERARTRGLVAGAGLVSLLAVPLLTATGWWLLARLDRPRGDGTYATAASLSGVARVWPAVVAHLVAGGGAIVLAAVLGPRAGKYNRDGSTNAIPAHSLPTMVGGDLLLFVGLPMLAAAIAGDPAGRAVNALLAAAAATCAGVASCALRDRHAEAVLPWSAAVGGLVAGSLSGPADPGIAIAAGAVVGALLPTLARRLDLTLRVDDVGGLSLPHVIGALAGVGGATLAAALEGQPSAGSTLLLTSIGLSAGVAALVAGAVVTLIVGSILRAAGWLRVDAALEVEGLDLAQHDVNAYPDFQQTLIKSYHLRQ